MYKNILSKESIYIVLSQIIFGILGALLVHVMLHRNSPIVATVNITGLEDSFIRETSSQTLSPNDAKQKVALFAMQLDQSVKKLAQEKNMILVPKEAVIAGSIDVTQSVANDIKKRMAS